MVRPFGGACGAREYRPIDYFIFLRKIFVSERHIFMRTGKALFACEGILKMPDNTFFRTEGEKVLYYKADLSVQRFDRLKRNLRNFTIRADEGVNASYYGRIFFSCVV